MSLYSRFCAWLSGWPEGSKEDKKIKADEEHFKVESKARKAKKPRGLNPKKKKTRKQGNMK